MIGGFATLVGYGIYTGNPLYISFIPFLVVALVFYIFLVSDMGVGLAGCPHWDLSDWWSKKKSWEAEDEKHI